MNRKELLLLLLKIGVSIALLAYLLLTTDLGALYKRLRSGDTALLVAAAVLYGLILLLSTWRWQLLLKAQGFEAPMGRLSATYLVATFFNNFLPSNIGGDVIRVRDGSELTGSTTSSLAVVAIDRILGLGALYLLAVGAFLAGGPLLQNLAGAKPALIVLGVVFGVIAYVFFRPGIARRLVAASGLGSREWVRQKFQIVQGAVHVYRKQMLAIWSAFGASIALQALLVCYYYDIARSLGISVPLSACFLIVPLCNLVQTIPISFNGWGLRESVFILYFGQLGLSRDGALALSLVGAGLMVLLSLSGAVVWTSRGAAPSR